MPKLVTAADGDTLCTIAMEYGFLDCEPLRKEPANSAFLNRPLKAGDTVTVPDVETNTFEKVVDSLYKMVKKNSPPVSIRLVRPGEDDSNYKHHPSLSVACVSKYRTDRAGPDGKAAFSSKFGYDKDASADPDAFQIEVVDPTASGTVMVKLEALKPVYDKDGVPTGWTPFSSEPDSALRKKDAVECKALGAAPVVFRSRYLRLVTDTEDQKAIPDQTLLVSEITDSEENSEILDQKIRATYSIARCNAPRKCAVTATVPIGRDKIRVKVALQVLQDGRGQPYAPLSRAKKSVVKFTRRFFAQADMSIKLVEVREVPRPGNLFSIADRTGDLAAGGAIRVRLAIDGTSKMVACATTRDDTPIQTALKLAEAINAEFLTAGIDAQARASENPAVKGQPRGSADVLVGDVWKQKIEIDAVLEDDPAQHVDIGVLDGSPITDFPETDGHVGTRDERVLIKNFDSGADRVDFFVTNRMKGCYGEAFIPGLALGSDERTNDTFRNTVLVIAGSVKDDHDPVTVPHELGHVLMDAFHADRSTELMDALLSASSHMAKVDGAKRISDYLPPTVIDLGCKKGSPCKLLRTANTAVITGW